MATGRFASGATMLSQPGDYTLLERLGEPSDEGEVYHAKYRRILDCAIKFVEPEKIEKTIIENEVRLLSLLRHTHLVRITDFGTGAPRDDQKQGLLPDHKQWFYIVMELVPGKPLSDAWRQVDGPGLLRLLDQLLDAVVYLHERGVLHMDLKPKNVLVEEANSNVVIIDLGFSVVADVQRFREVFQLDNPGSEFIDSSEVYTGSQDVYVASTKEFTRPNRLQLLGKKVPRKLLSDNWFPDHDLFAIGVLMGQALQEPQFEQWTSIRRGLQLIHERLIEGSYYQEASHVRADLKKLQRGYLAPLGIPELSPIPDPGMHIALATTAVQITERVRAIIEHPFFQRLRYIPQLDFEQLVYPDARHSRLSHSLSTFDLTRRAIVHMLSDVGFRLAVEPEDLEGTLLFALLHDIGHYPLSHMFEDFRGRETRSQDEILLDDDLFEPLIKADSRNHVGLVIKERLDRQDSLAALVVSYFGEASLNAMWSISNCANSDLAPKKVVHRLLSGLVSSAIDFDKVAYLMTDSAMSGVKYGGGIDLHGFFTSLIDPITNAVPMTTKAPPNEEDQEEDTGPIIGIREKGLAAAESIILARYWMLSRVYWHHTNRALMAAFKFTINELVSAGKLDFSAYFKDVFWSGEVEALKYLSKKFSSLWRKEKVNPLDGLLNGKRGMYKRLITISTQQEPDLNMKLLSHDDTAATNADTSALESVVSSEFARRGIVIVDIPRRTRDTINLEQIRIIGDPEAGDKMSDRSLKQASPLLSRLHEEFLNEVKKSRVFLHPLAYEELKKSNKLEEARHKVRTALSTKLG